MKPTQVKNPFRSRRQQIVVDLEFHVPPENGGQIVEVSYASDERGIYRRTHDKSDGSVNIVFRPWRETDPEDFTPWNGAPDF